MRYRRVQGPSGLGGIRAFFAQPPIQHLGLELAVCWILERLLEGDSYPTALMHDLSDAHPKLRLSETVLQQALSFLDQDGAISSYSQRCPSRGRPRRMLHLLDDRRSEAQALMSPWRQWLDENEGHTHGSAHASGPGFHAAAHPAPGCRPGLLPAGRQ
ncbi:MAG: Pex protein [Cyanobacteria bacterium M_surface_10_m2_179]|nr:Pex protein [Cyanobacteria bacterium M_surface_10_m2_179]